MKPYGDKADSDIPAYKESAAAKTFIIIDKNSGTVKKDHLNLAVLASSSKGNALLISDSSTTVLLDAGLSGKRIEQRLESINFSPEHLDAILVSHEHSDHILGVGVLSRRYGLPVYASRKTFETASKQLGKLHSKCYFECGKSFEIGKLVIHPFSVSHDAEDPACFTIKQNGLKIGVATDLGVPTSVVRQHLKGCNLLVLEANHDPLMLEEGPYPWPLKQRIKSRIGHLSNEDAKKLLNDIRHDGLTHVILAHLSEINNTPEKALITVSEALENGCPTKIIVAG